MPIASSPPAANETRAASLRVIHILRAPVGGLFRHVRDLAREQCQRGLDVGIVCDSLTENPFARSVLSDLGELCTLGVNQLPMQRAPGLGDFRAIREVVRVVRPLSPHILHGHGAKGASYARLIAPAVGGKAICTPHGGSLHYSYRTLRGAMYLIMERLLKHKASGFIFESEYARRAFSDLVGAPGCTSRVIHNGLLESEFAPLETKSPLYDFVFVGELRKLKGIHVLLDAIETVSRLNKLTVLIVGDGKESAAIKLRIHESGLEKFVTLVPAIHPATNALCRARCLLFPSYSESLPYVVLEGIAAGVPLLATRVGGVPEIFGPFAERLLSPGDATILAEAMLAVLSDPDRALAEAGALTSYVRQHFSVNKMAAETVDMYQRIAGA